MKTAESPGRRSVCVISRATNRIDRFSTRKQDRRSVREIDAAKVLETKRRPRSKGDSTRAVEGAQAFHELLNHGLIHLFGEDDHVKPAAAQSVEEAFHASFGVHQIMNDLGRAEPPAEDDDVSLAHDGGEAFLQPSDRRMEPLGHDGDERSHEEHVSEDGDDRRNEAEQCSLIIAEVPRIGQSQKGPPDGAPSAVVLEPKDRRWGFLVKRGANLFAIGQPVTALLVLELTPLVMDCWLGASTPQIESRVAHWCAPFIDCQCCMPLKTSGFALASA